ncbi:ornithine cyclodeaminase family protein [Infirmifilum sp. SLHALR2]|nr:MAG: hypothetical protein B7L53_00155 [Thermofilum sp. NZ13]
MSGTLFTAVRTGAVNAVAAKYLARKDSEIAGIVGAGVIGRTTAWGLQAVLELSELKIYDIKRDKAEALARELGPEAKPVSSVQEAVSESDVVVTATTSEEPFVEAVWLKSSVLCIQMGKREIKEKAIVSMNKIVVDNWEQYRNYDRALVTKLYKSGLIPPPFELPQIVAGQSPGREGQGERILFDSFGLACEDLAVAYRLYQDAVKGGFETKLALWDYPHWV